MGQRRTLGVYGTSEALVLRGPALGSHRTLRGQADVPGQADRLQQADREPAGVHLPPSQAVAGRSGKGVVVIVPALAQAQQAAEPVIARVVVRLVILPAEDVAD